MVRPTVIPATRQLSEAHYSTLPGDSEMRINPGALLADGDLEIVVEIGRGGIAVVYRAIDHVSGGQEVALKIGTAEASGRRTPQRFRREHRIGLMLGEHEHIVRPLRVGVLNAPAGFEGRMYLVTELVQGKPLDLVMAVHQHGLEVDRACAIGRDVGLALVAMHEAGIVHRDIKPGNVLVADDGEPTAKVIDFSLAYVHGDAWAVSEASISGTALYMAPEQALGRCPSPPADIYAFGVMLYELFSGSPPHDRLPHAELLARKCDRTRGPISIGRMCRGLDSRLVSVIDRCLRYEPSERPTAGELVEVFDQLTTGSSARSVPVRPKPSPQRGLMVLLWVVSLVSVLALVAVILLLLAWPHGRPMVAAARVTSPPERPAVIPAAVVEPDARRGRPAPEPAQEAAPSPGGGSDERSPMTEAPSAPAATPRPKARPTSAKRASKKTDECPATVRAAKQAAIRHQWGQVLQQTDRTECWSGGAQSQRALLRTQAYFETARYADCVRTGRGLSDPHAIRWVRVCEAKSEGSLR